MSADDAESTPTPASIAAYVKKNTAKMKMGSMHGPMESVREAEYEGHHIVIRTTYRIEVDGHAVTGHIDLTNEGQVAYHGLPNMSFDSAVDLVKSLIDQFPEDFRPGIPPLHGGMGRMGGMTKSGMTAIARPGVKRKAPAVKSAAKSTARPKKKASLSRKRK